MKRIPAIFIFLLTVLEAGASGLPSSVDNSVNKFFPPVFDQIGGSCAQASTVGYMLTYEFNRLLDRDGSLPENRMSYLYTWNLVNDGKDQGSFQMEGIDICMQNGIMSEADFPQQKYSYDFCWASGYDKYFRAMHYMVESYEYFDLWKEGELDRVKNFLYDKNGKGTPGGVLTFSAMTVGWAFSIYDGPSETGYKRILSNLAYDGPHAMTIVGYDDTVESVDRFGNPCLGAFIVVNSWGLYFHDRGRYYLPYHFFFNEKDSQILGHEFTGVNVVFSKPSVAFKVAMDFSSRDDIAFRYGVANKATGEEPSYIYQIPVVQHQGGDHPMCGRDKSSQIEFGFNFTRYAGHIDEMEEPCFVLDVLREKRGSKDGSGFMLGFEVLDYRDDYEHPKMYVAENVRGVALEKGHNLFRIPTVKPRMCSFSKVEWLSGDQVIGAPFVFRTAKGRYAKVKFSDYDRSSGTIHIKYVYSPSGDRNLKQ